MVIPIVIGVSSQYLPFAQVAVQSLVDTTIAGTLLEVIFFYWNLTEEQIAQVQAWAAQRPNLSLQFLDAAKALQSQYGITYSWPGKETMMGIFSPFLLPQHSKILLLDCDIIVCKDISTLYRQPLGDALLAAALDADFAGQFARGDKGYRKYYAQEVPLQAPGHYLQAGVLLLNATMFRIDYTALALAKLLFSRTYIYDDQDAINLYFSHRAVHLDMRWNVLHDNDRFRRRYVIRFAPKEIRQAYEQARLDPYIIHYAGADKPWLNTNCDFAGAFWAVAVRAEQKEFCQNSLQAFRLSSAYRKRKVLLPLRAAKRNAERAYFLLRGYGHA